MQYQDEVTGEIEYLWNSRDGVTPFTITSKDGNSAQHVNWEQDLYEPLHMPRIGDRVFVDLTLEHARVYRTRDVERFWDNGEFKMSNSYSSKEEAIEELAESDVKTEGSPHLIVVDLAFLDELKQSRSPNNVKGEVRETADGFRLNLWHPQWGGYSSTALVEFDRITGCVDGEVGCFELHVCHDGESPTESPAFHRHCCNPLQFATFGLEVYEAMTKYQKRDDVEKVPEGEARPILPSTDELKGLRDHINRLLEEGTDDEP
jgi:hypothetical protein